MLDDDKRVRDHVGERPISVAGEGCLRRPPGQEDESHC